jgi:hypothetical protein
MLNASMLIDTPNKAFLMQKNHLEDNIGHMPFNTPLFEELQKNNFSAMFSKIKSYLPIRAFLAVINFEQNKPIKNELNDIFKYIKDYYDIENISQKEILTELMEHINQFEATFYDPEMSLHVSLISQILAK